MSSTRGLVSKFFEAQRKWVNNHSLSSDIGLFSSPMQFSKRYMHDQSGPNIISPKLFQERRDVGVANFLTIDVREPDELKVSKLTGHDWINLPQSMLLAVRSEQELMELLQETKKKKLDNYEDIYLLCQKGVRSSNVAHHLHSMDLDQMIWNIEGGIDLFVKEAPHGVTFK